MEALLDIRDLCISFPLEGSSKTIVDRLSLSIQPGKMTALVGESGSGKSVTALSILQLLSPSVQPSGQILFHDAGNPSDLLKLSEAALQRIRGNRISMVFQEPMTSLNPLMTCGEQVMESLSAHQGLSRSQAKKSCIEWFQKVELPNPASIIDRYPHQLSGGQKQRVMIAMAICNHPSLLIADEPTTALDARVQKSIMRLLRTLQEEMGMSVLLITHDLGLVADVAHDVAVMYRGSIVESGVAMQVLRKPTSPYTRALLACRPSFHTAGTRLPVVSDFMEAGKSPQIIIKTDSVYPSSEMITTAEPHLVVDHLSVEIKHDKKKIWDRQAAKMIVNDVSFSIQKGCITGLVGESGCGKTTLGKAIFQLIRPHSGTVRLGGRELTGLTESELRDARRDIQVVFQDPYGSLNPRLSIGEALMEPMRVHGLAGSLKEAREKASAILETVQLEGSHLNRYPHQFSGGQRQRICIARALTLEPSFLIFDESVSALDVSVQAQVLNLVNDLKKSHHLTALFISHDLSVVKYISNEILVMKDGAILESGPSDAIMEHPREPYTKELIDSIPGRALAGI